MRICSVILLFLGFAFFLPFKSRAQSAADTSVRTKAIQNAVAFYQQTVDKQSGLFNGPEYELYAVPFTKGHPYFQSNGFSLGSVFYDGINYQNVELLYDVVRDELLLLHHDSLHRINLIKDKVERFSLQGHSFIRLTDDTAVASSPAPGFYDLLYSGNVDFLAKRIKNVQQFTEGMTLENKVFPKELYYLFKDGVYHSVRNKKGLLNLLKNKRSAIQQYIKANNIQFKHNFENAATSVVAYYDQITK